MAFAIEETFNGVDYDVEVRVFVNNVEAADSPYISGTTPWRMQVVESGFVFQFAANLPTTLNVNMGDKGPFVYDPPDGYEPYGPITE